MERKFFVFKTSHHIPTYIGDNFKPKEKGVIYGLEYVDKPTGTVIYTGKDRNGFKLSIIENKTHDIDSIERFREYYPEISDNINLMMTQDKFSGCVANVISKSLMKKSAKKKSLPKRSLLKRSLLKRNPLKRKNN